MKGVSRIGRGIGTRCTYRDSNRSCCLVSISRSFDVARNFEFRAETRTEFADERQASNDSLRFLAATSHVSLGNPSFFSRLLPYGVTSPLLVSFSPLSLSVENKCHHRNRTTLELALFVSRYHFFLSYTFETEKFHFIYNNLDSPLELTRSQQKIKIQQLYNLDDCTNYDKKTRFEESF